MELNCVSQLNAAIVLWYTSAMPEPNRYTRFWWMNHTSFNAQFALHSPNVPDSVLSSRLFFDCTRISRITCWICIRFLDSAVRLSHENINGLFTNLRHRTGSSKTIPFRIAYAFAYQLESWRQWPTCILLWFRTAGAVGACRSPFWQTMKQASRNGVIAF